MPSHDDEANPDVSAIFAAIDSQTSPNDRATLVAVRDAVRRHLGSYAYLEIGSHLGGTLQAFVQDAACTHLYSIDSRPAAQPDERGGAWGYPNNTTDRMRALLTAIDPMVGERLLTLDADASTIDPAVIYPRPHLLFVDGEHTDVAVCSDAEFCRSVAHPDGAVIVFHDAQIVYRGLERLLSKWRADGVAFHAYPLPDCVMVVELGLSIHDDVAVWPLLLDSHVGYLASLRMNDSYRTMARTFPAKQYWRARQALARRLGRPDPLGSTWIAPD